MTCHSIKLLHQKFVVVAEMSTGKPLELFFDIKLPGMHIALFEAAQEKWKKKGIEISCFGGGMYALVDNFVVFYGKSGQFGRYEDETVMKLAIEQEQFKDQGLLFISKAGENDPLNIVNSLRR